jgi:cysteinyl-tRNA synthetase
MTDIRLFNTLTRRLENFTPITPGRVGIYTCGPTVYSFAHVGNMRAYIFADILRRTFENNTYSVTHVMNITDVGHLTSDADEGEDKMLVAQQREGGTSSDIAKKYTAAFFEGTRKLNIKPPTQICAATGHILEQIELVEQLEAKGFTYITEDGVYFDTTRFPRYGDLAQLDIGGLRAGERVEVSDKRSKTDFALWKFSPKGVRRDMEWDSPWGKGFPGWHIECSAMSMKYLGPSFDIHTGGIDHIPVHHTNEIAQSEAATGRTFVNYWMHCEFLRTAEKMSKSSGNVVRVEDLERSGFDPLAFRYLCLTTHYRNPTAFSLAILTEAAKSFERLNRQVIDLNGASPAEVLSARAGKLKNRIAAALNEDLSTAVALVHLREALALPALSPKEKAHIVAAADAVLGLDLGRERPKQLDIPQEVALLVEQRQQARKQKNWQSADQFRHEINQRGFTVEDTPAGPRIGKAVSP